MNETGTALCLHHGLEKLEKENCSSSSLASHILLVSKYVQSMILSNQSLDVNPKALNKVNDGEKIIEKVWL